MTISARDSDDALVFDMESLRWVAGGSGEEKTVEEEAWCQVGEWAESGSRGNRVSSFIFPGDQRTDIC